MDGEDVEEEDPAGIADSVAAGPGTVSVGQRIGRDDQGRAQTDEDVRGTGPLVDMLQGQGQDAEAEQEDTAPGGEADVVAEQQQGQGREHGGTAAHDGIAHGQVHLVISLRDADVICQVETAGKCQQAPGFRRRYGQEGQDGQGSQPAAQGVYGRFEKFVGAAFDDAVPGGVQQGRGQHKKQDMSVHGYDLASLVCRTGGKAAKKANGGPSDAGPQQEELRVRPRETDPYQPRQRSRRPLIRPSCRRM